MVDKATARMLVYGALGTLAIVLLVAVYALATKGSVQNELEAKLLLLRQREEDIATKEKAREAALREFQASEKKLQKEEVRREAVESERDEAKNSARVAEHEKVEMHGEAEIMRRKLWDTQSQKELEALEKKSEAELMAELEKEGKEFFSDADELSKEEVDEVDKTDLAQEVKEADRFKKAFEEAKQKGGDEESLENMEELGELNEVYLDELNRDAVRNSGRKWKNPKRVSRMNENAHQMDLTAEALRQKRAKAKLAQEDHDLDDIEREAEKAGRDDNDKEFAPEINTVAKEIEADGERVQQEIGHGNERDEFVAAKVLERDSENAHVKLAKLKQEVDDSPKLTNGQKKDRDALIDKLEKELQEMENEAQHVEKGLERRRVRHDANRMAKAANHLNSQPDKLKHAKHIPDQVSQILTDENHMLDAMKKGNLAEEEQYGAKLAEEGDELEEDAEHLFDEAEAGDFDDLDEKLIDEQLAKELEDSGQDLEHDAGDVDTDDRQREIRESAGHIAAEASKFGDEEKQFAKSSELKKLSNKINEDAKVLGQAVGEQDWDEENRMAAEELKEADQLDTVAQDLEKEVVGAPAGSLSDSKRSEDEAAIKEIRQGVAALKKEAQGVQADVQNKAASASQRLEQKIAAAKKVAGKGSNFNNNNNNNNNDDKDKKSSSA